MHTTEKWREKVVEWTSEPARTAIITATLMSKRKQNLALKLPLYGMCYGEESMVSSLYMYILYAPQVCVCVGPRARQKRRAAAAEKAPRKRRI